MKGGSRNAKTEAQRALDGSRNRPRHHKQPDVAGECEAPKLTKPQRVYWDYFAPIMQQARMLTPADRQALRLYCVALVQVDELLALQAAPEYARVVLNVTVDGAGNERMKAETHPYDAQLRQWLEIARHHQAECGLSPTARTRVAVAGKPEPERPNALAALQARANVVSIKRGA